MCTIVFFFFLDTNIIIKVFYIYKMQSLVRGGCDAYLALVRQITRPASYHNVHQIRVRIEILATRLDDFWTCHFQLQLVKVFKF